jgi:hypothetical protein
MSAKGSTPVRGASGLLPRGVRAADCSAPATR